MKRIFVLFWALMFSLYSHAQNASLEVFYDPQPDLLNAATENATRIVMLDSIEGPNIGLSGNENSYRIRGLLLPPQTGYYKFFIISGASTGWARFYLSCDSIQYHKRLILQELGISSWPTDINTMYNYDPDYLSCQEDSVYLIQNEPYYFDIGYSSYPYYISPYGLRWVLPGTNYLQCIRGEFLRLAPPLNKSSAVLMEVFHNRMNADFTQIRNDALFPEQKFMLKELTTADDGNSLNNFSARIRGYLVPPSTSQYTFFLSCDDAAQFWLSPDTSVANAQLKINVAETHYDWTQNTSIQTMVAGQKYYFELLYHDSINNDRVRLGWAIQNDTTPEVIGIPYMIGYCDSVVPSKIKLSTKKLFLGKNQSFTPGVKIYPWNLQNRKVLWTSMNPSIALVNSDGQIYANNFGECKIIAKLEADTLIRDTLTVNISAIDWELFNYKLTFNFDSLHLFNNTPDEHVELNELNTIDFATSKDHFVSRIRGYIIPPDSGDYSFYFAADDVAQFWLSPDTSVANAILKSDIDSISTDWNQKISNQTLVAGNKYYFEILHYDSVYTDMIKLGWKSPRETVPVVLATPFIISAGDNKPATALFFRDSALRSYPGWTFKAKCNLLPWNATNKSILYQSSNSSVASINNEGLITAVSVGECWIIAKVASDTTLRDSIHFTVNDYYGPFFVMPDSVAYGEGRSWDDAISLTKLLDFLNQGTLTQNVTIYISEGIYKPTNTNDRNITFKLDNVILRGGYSISSMGVDTLMRNIDSFQTILSGDIGQPQETFDNSYHVVTSYRNVLIDGLTIRDGRASCSSYGNTPGFYIFKPEDNGGGVYIPGSQSVTIRNCRIINNSAWNSGGGIFCRFTSQLQIYNTDICNNAIQQTLITSGGIFNICVNGNGGGITVGMTTLILKNSRLYQNTAVGHALALYAAGATANIENCSFYDNYGPVEDVFCDGSVMTMKNSTLQGRLGAFFGVSLSVESSTISGGGSVGGYGPNTVNITNSIWSGINLYSIPDTGLVTASYSIVGDLLVGSNKNNILQDSIPNCMSFLDSMAYNGGPTPTMRLKNVPFNPAKSLGNPLYLDSLDQRGYLRKDSVSIGAYQWIRPDSISVGSSLLLLCQGDSIIPVISVFPDYADDTSFSITNLHDTIAFSENGYIHALAAGNAGIIFSTIEGNESDTMDVAVTGIVGYGTISGDSIVCQGDESVVYQVTPIENATSYFWTLPSGTAGSSAGNTIAVDFDLTATSGQISVIGQNACFDGPGAVFSVSVNIKPATPIITLHTDTLVSDAATGNQWFDDNGPIAGATQQYYIVTENGSYYVVVSTNGCSSDSSDIISVTNAGINENEIALTIFPNPATNQITISGIETGGTLRLYDLSGKLLLERENKDNTLELNGIASGSYVLEIRAGAESGSEVIRGRVVIK